MKIREFAVWGCLLLASEAGAQVVNDDCVGGLAQGVWMLPINSNNCDQPGSGYGLTVIDSTDFAIPNFPYPTIPSSCTGYTPNVSVGGKDRWYSFRVNCDLQFTAQCSDSCHISFWSGTDCSMLTPISCYTLLPSQSLTGLVSALGVMPSLDTLSMQISDNGSGTDLNFQVCLMNPNPPCVSFFVTPEATPVTCFLYEVSVTPTSSSSSTDGGATLILHTGNGPFDVVWATGETTFTRNDLGTGWHSYTIADAQGCEEIDSVFVPVDTTVGMFEVRSKHDCGANYNTVTNELTFAEGSAPRSLIVLDAFGRTIRMNSSANGRSTFPLPQLTPGLYVAQFSTHDGLACRLKFVPH